MGGTLEHLIMNANAVAAGPVANHSLVRLQLREVFIRGLRERTWHSDSAVFVKISIVGAKNLVLKTSISSSPTTPSWPMENPAGLFIPASSVVTFSVFRHHRVRPDELIGEIESTAWTFLHNEWVSPKTESEDSPKMGLRTIMQISSAGLTEGGQNEAECRLDCEKERVADLYERFQEKFVKWQNVQDNVLEMLKHLITICKTLDSMAEGVPICKAASVILHAVMLGIEKLIEKRKNIDSEIVQLIQVLHEAVTEASLGASETKHEVAKIAGECAIIFDKWISTNVAVQLVKAAHGSIHDRIGHCHERLSSFKDRLKGCSSTARQADLASGGHDISFTPL